MFLQMGKLLLLILHKSGVGWADTAARQASKRRATFMLSVVLVAGRYYTAMNR